MARSWSLLLLFACAQGLPLWAQLSVSAPLASEREARVAQIPLGRSLTRLYGPWKFTAGDSPINPATRRPLWSEPDFDDSQWETVDLNPTQASIDPTSGWRGYVTGWTAKGHRGFWGYAWYRIRIREQAFADQEKRKLAVWDVDDAYQLFADGRLFGMFGVFRIGVPPAAPWNEPEMFDLPEERVDRGSGIVSIEHVLAFRIWCGPGTMYQNPDGGGLHVAPVIGSEAAVKAAYQTAWVEIVLSYMTNLAESLIYFVLAIAAFSLILFDRSDRLYVWLAGVFLATPARSIANLEFHHTTDHTNEAARKIVAALERIGVRHQWRSRRVSYGGRSLGHEDVGSFAQANCRCGRSRPHGNPPKRNSSRIWQFYFARNGAGGCRSIELLASH